MKLYSVINHSFIEKILIFLFILTCAFFNPTKELVAGGVSLPEVILVGLFCYFFYKIFKYIIFEDKFVILSLCAIAFVSISFSYNFTPHSEIKHLLRIVEYFLIFITFYSLTKYNTIAIFSKAFLISGLIVSLYTYIQFFFPVLFIFQNWGPSKVLDFNYDNVIYQKRMISFLDNPLNLTSYLALLLGFVHYYIDRKLLKYLFLIIVYIAGLLTVSRSFILCIAVSLAIVVYENRKYPKRLMFVFFLLLLSVTPYLSTFVIQDDSNFDRLFDKGNTDESTGQRVYVLGSSIRMIGDYFLLGVGPGNYPFYYEFYRNMRASTDPTLSTAENIFLQFLLDYGLIPFLIFLYILYDFYKSSIKLMLYNKFFKATTLSISLYLMTGFSHSLGAAANNFIFFSILGMSAKLYQLWKYDINFSNEEI